MTTRINYEGPYRGAIMLSRELGKAGIVATYDAPREERGVEESLVHVAYFIADAAASGAIATSAGLAVKAVVDKFKRDHPGAKADIEEE
jgi:hypothetical protein